MFSFLLCEFFFISLTYLGVIMGSSTDIKKSKREGSCERIWEGNKGGKKMRGKNPLTCLSNKYFKEMKTLSSFTQPHVVPSLYYFIWGGR